MDDVTRANDIVLLFDNYNSDSQNLHTSFKLAGYECPAVVIEDDGFLPEDVMSVYGFFLGMAEENEKPAEKPCYFNEVKVPEYWEISGTNSNGTINDLSKVRGKIFYADPNYKRLVKTVDWYDERGVVRSSDHYNRYGIIYARTIFNAKGQRVNKSYFDQSGKEIIMENYVTGDIILNEEQEIHFFKTKTDFVMYFLKSAQFEQSRLAFNSLSTPFFVSQQLKAALEKRDVLFWQEPIADSIPGNMQIILDGNATRTEKIYVQKRNSYDRLLALKANKEMVCRCGFIYPFVRENEHRMDVLICTNSDRIEKINEIVKALPQMHFHIAALTEMSSKLLELGNELNVSLYPGATTRELDQLFELCDWYLDINRESEIVSAISRAFLNNQLILAFKETLHSGDYVAEEHRYSIDTLETMVADIQRLCGDSVLFEQQLEVQRDWALAETKEQYIF